MILTNLNKVDEIVLNENLKTKVKIFTIFTDSENVGSQVYVKLKIKAAEKLGIITNLIPVNESNLITELESFAKNPTPFLIQQPIKGIIDDDLQKIVKELIDEKYDVDGFNSYYYPPTALSAISLLTSYNIPTEDKHVVIIGRSKSLGWPLASMLSSKQYNANITIVHSKTSDIAYFTKQAEIIISCVGQPHIIKPNMINNRVTIIDVGVSKNKQGELCGDLHPDCQEHTANYSPSKGGVGPGTVYFLMQNILKFYNKHSN